MSSGQQPQSIELSQLDGLPPLRALAVLLAEKARRVRQNRLLNYWPYPKQAKFHKLGATKRQRLLRAGNQQGKTMCAGAEMSYHLTGVYPKWWKGRRFDRPIVAWAGSDTGETTRDNPQRALVGPIGEWGTGMIPHKAMGDYALASGVADLIDYVRVKHVSGGWSTLRFKYYAQGREKWQGPPVDVVWYDEEPDEDIYDEGLARTIATNGIAMLSFTPLKGVSAVVKRFLMSPQPDMADVQMTIEDADHIPESERARIIASFAPHEREARARGVPVLGSGRVFPVAEESISCEPIAIAAHWPRLVAIDFGWDHPTAIVWLAWDRDTDTIYVYDCYRQRGADVVRDTGIESPPIVHAALLKARGNWIPVSWPHDGLQTEKGSGIQLAESYRKLGANMRPEHAHFEETGQDGETRSTGISVEAGITAMLDRMATGRFKVFKHLNDWWDEYRLYHRLEGKIVKEGDDLMSATRIAVMDLRHAAVEPRKGDNYRPPANWRF